MNLMCEMCIDTSHNFSKNKSIIHNFFLFFDIGSTSAKSVFDQNVLSCVCMKEKVLYIA